MGRRVASFLLGSSERPDSPWGKVRYISNMSGKVPCYCWLEVEIQAPHVTSTSKARGGRWPCGYLTDIKVLVSYLALSDTTLVGSSGDLVTTCWRWKSRAFPAWVRIKQYVFGGVQLDKRGIVLEFFLLRNCIFLVLRIERRDLLFCFFSCLYLSAFLGFWSLLLQVWGRWGKRKTQEFTIMSLLGSIRRNMV